MRVAVVVLATVLGTTLGAGSTRATRVEAGDPAPAESVATIDAEWKLIETPSRADYRRFLTRYRAAAGGAAQAQEIATKVLRDFDGNDKDAHDVLGHKEFALEVPEEISYRRYPFVRIVEEAGAKRWFDDLEPYTAALEAYARCTKHAKRLADDPAYAALDVARRGIDQDAHFHAYNYDAVFASPYLICYSTKERIDEAAMWKMPRAERARAWAELDARRVGYKRVLAEKARIYTQVYREFLKRYGESCDLRPLMDAFGGRPDYPAGHRTYREGCPLIVWVFSDRDAWRDYHDNVMKSPIDPSALGYHSKETGWVYTFDRAPDDRETEISVNTEAATLQLLHWFTRQRNEWGPYWARETYFSAGFAPWFGAVTMKNDRSLEFTGVNSRMLKGLRETKDDLVQADKKLFVFPLRELTSFEGKQSVTAWGVEHWWINSGVVSALFDIQSWALVLFLNEAAEGRYRPAFARLVNAMLLVPHESEGYAANAFKRAFTLESNDDWRKLETEFEAYYADLAKRDPATVGAAPPALADWPGYVAPDLEAPTGPPVGK